MCPRGEGDGEDDWELSSPGFVAQGCRFLLLASGSMGQAAGSFSGAPRWMTKKGNRVGVGIFNKLVLCSVRSRRNRLLLPPLVYGNQSLDGGTVFIGGRRRIRAGSVSFLAVLLLVLLLAMVVLGGRADAADGDLRRPGSDEVYKVSSSSRLVLCDLKKLLVCSSVCSTYDVRPLSKSAVAVVCVGIEASGEVPAAVFGDGKRDFFFLLDGGEREGLDCFFKSFSEVFSALIRDLCIISCSYGVLCNMFVRPLYGIQRGF